MSILIPSHEELNADSALEYALTVPDHRIDFLHITSGELAKSPVTVKEITQQPPDELSQATINNLVDQVEAITGGAGREVRMLHTTGTIGEATIRYADALKSELIILAVDGNEATRSPSANEAVEVVTSHAPAAFTIIQE